MKLIKISIVIAFIFTAKAHSQTANVQNISLAEAYELGAKNRYDVQANKINVVIANNIVAKNKKEWLPDISATGMIRYNTQLQTMVLDGFGPGTQKITMGTTNLSYLSLDLTQNIFKPGLTTDIKIAKNDGLLEAEKNREKDISIKQTIAEAYLNVILKKVQWKLAASASDRNLKYYTIAKDKSSLNVILENDFLKTKLDYENAKVAAQEAKNNYTLALMQLKYQLNLDNTAEIVLKDSVETFQNENQVAASGTSNRTELKQLMLQYESNRLRLSKSKQYGLPTVSIIGNYTTQFQSENFDYSKNLWSPYNYIALKVTVPLTGNIKNANTIKDYQFKIRQNDYQIKQKQLDVDYEIAKFKTELNNAEGTAKTSRSNLDLSKSVYEKQISMFQLGSVTYSSMLDMETSMNTAEQNYVKAVYNYLLAKVNYQKSIGEL